MASLTREQWLEMWSDILIIQKNTDELRVLSDYLPPYRRNQLRGIITANNSLVEVMKTKVQSVIGQLE